MAGSARRIKVTGAFGSYGEKGADGKSAYEYARDGGYTGTEEEFAARLADDAAIFTISCTLSNEDDYTNGFGSLIIDKTFDEIKEAIDNRKVVQCYFMGETIPLISFGDNAVTFNLRIFYYETNITIEKNGDSSWTRHDWSNTEHAPELVITIGCDNLTDSVIIHDNGDGIYDDFWDYYSNRLPMRCVLFDHSSDSEYHLPFIGYDSTKDVYVFSSTYQSKDILEKTKRYSAFFTLDYDYSRMTAEILVEDLPTDDHIIELINTALAGIPNASEVAY